MSSSVAIVKKREEFKCQWMRFFEIRVLLTLIQIAQTTKTLSRLHYKLVKLKARQLSIWHRELAPVYSWNNFKQKVLSPWQSMN